MNEFAKLIQRARRDPGRILLFCGLAFGLFVAAAFVNSIVDEIGRSTAFKLSSTPASELPVSQKSAVADDVSSKSELVHPTSSDPVINANAHDESRQDIQQINQSTRGSQSPAIANTGGDVTISFDGKTSKEGQQ